MVRIKNSLPLKSRPHSCTRSGSLFQRSNSSSYILLQSHVCRWISQPHGLDRLPGKLSLRRFQVHRETATTGTCLFMQLWPVRSCVQYMPPPSTWELNCVSQERLFMGPPCVEQAYHHCPRRGFSRGISAWDDEPYGELEAKALFI
jgi:hypothetical protein